MPTDLIIQLLNVFAPIVLSAVARHQAATGQTPTRAQLMAELERNIDFYLAEGAQWKATHPDPIEPGPI